MFTYLHVLDPEIPIDSKENMIETLFKGSDSFFFKEVPMRNRPDIRHIVRKNYEESVDFGIVTPNQISIIAVNYQALIPSSYSSISWYPH